MVDVDGVVGGLAEPVDDADPPSGLGGGAEDGQGEGLAVYDLRAAEGENQSARRDGGDGGRCLANAGGSTINRS